MDFLTNLLQAIEPAVPYILGWGASILLALVATKFSVGDPGVPNADATGLGPADCSTGYSESC